MNLAMECTSSDAVLDLRKVKDVKPIDIPQPMKFSPPPEIMKYSPSQEHMKYTSPPQEPMKYSPPLPEPMKYSPPPAEPIKYSSPPPVTQAYAPLTPPYYGSPTYQTSIPAVPEGSSSPQTPTPAALVTSTYLMTSNVINAGRAGKPTRPFKAYPKDPLALSSFQDSTEEYIEFRQRMLAQLEMVSGRNNSNMRRSNSPQQPSSTAELDDKTAAYWERRRKNNEAAKRSRDARRAKEDEIAIRAAFLEQENIKLKYELATLRSETVKLRHLVYNR